MRSLYPPNEPHADKLLGADGCQSAEEKPTADQRASSVPAGRANGAASADRFLDAFDALVQAVRRARGASSQEHGRGRGLTLSQYGLLQPLADSDGARVRELAEQAGIAPSTATRILDALERRGIVERRPSSGDRRGVRITLTPAGRRMFDGEDHWMRAREREFYAHLPADERTLAPDLLKRLATLIDELAAGPRGPVGSGSTGRGRTGPRRTGRASRAQ